MEAIAFGFLAYFGAEIGEFAHKQYEKYMECKIEMCEQQEQAPIPIGTTITIKIEHNGTIVSETRLGDNNE